MKNIKSTKLRTQYEFIASCNRVHNNRYTYDKFVYVNSRVKGIITCHIHGDFNQSPDSHLNGRGCPSCGKLITRSKSSKEEFLEKVIKVHSHRYTYVNFEYSSARSLSNITCTIHGDFRQTPNNHLSGHGCPKCGKESHWRRSDYIKKANGRVCTFYTLMCNNDTEGFYKIGITFTSIEKRYSNKIPYNYKIISEIYGDAGEIWDLELREKKRLKDFNYQPQIKFKGSKTECFTQYKI